MSNEYESFKFTSLKLNLEDTEQLSLIGRALSSPERIRILKYLYDSPAIISKIADHFHLPLSSAAHHVHMLEKAGLISICDIPTSRGSQKNCILVLNSLLLNFYTENPEREISLLFQQSMPIGNYFDYQVSAPCGMISGDVHLVPTDETSAFCVPGRIHAQLIWISSGYLEYRFSNQCFIGGSVSHIVFSLELCSEFPGNRNDWPSDITVWLNDKEIGTIHSPGDYGDRHGRLTPLWWDDLNTQYGDLWWIKVTEEGCFINEKQVSAENMATLRLSCTDSIKLRIGVKPDAQYCGGLNLFGHQFGDYPQDIIMSVYGRQPLN